MSVEADQHQAIRSPWLMNRDDSVLVVVDLQERLLPLVLNSHRILWNAERLVKAASLLGVPILATEQYPKGLGPTVPHLKSQLGAVDEKLAFSCMGCESFGKRLEQTGKNKVLVIGIESHVCVQQTALDLIAAGYSVWIAVDAVSSRRDIDHQTALERLQLSGVFPTTTESALFEWVQTASASEFKAISQLVRQTEPEPPSSE